ncbi:tetratricopeptide repeat protein [Sporolactobacillus sp. THM7-7]|nr:tetratricopeptide repeat protein [Sporolactobacillus sp. THM7-7]
MKKYRKLIRRQGKVFLLPDLEDRILSKAMSFVKNKRYKEARDLFGRLLELDNRDLKGLYGWSICSVELGEYREAEKAVVRLLREGTAYHDDVFRLYLTILIEKKDYRQALREIHQMSRKSNLTHEMKAFLRQMETFCGMRLNEPGIDRSNGTPEPLSPERSGSMNWSELKKADLENQPFLIRKLASQLKKENLPEIEHFLLDENENQEMKTMLMCVVKESRLAKEIVVRKFGKVYRVVFDSPHFLYKAFADRVKEKIEDVLNSENPTLADMAIELGRLFTMNVYPKPLDPPSVKVWAAFFSIRAAILNEIEDAEKRMSELFHVSKTEIQTARKMAREVEPDSIW